MYRYSILALTAGSMLALTIALPITHSTPVLACSSQVNKDGPSSDRNPKNIKRDKAGPKRDVGARNNDAMKTKSDERVPQRDIQRDLGNLTRCKTFRGS
jgi:hypothetical protein